VDVDGRRVALVRRGFPHPALRATVPRGRPPAGARVRKPCSCAQRAPTRKGEGLGVREHLGSR
jgi:hypothetical protein